MQIEYDDQLNDVVDGYMIYNIVKEKSDKCNLVTPGYKER